MSPLLSIAEWPGAWGQERSCSVCGGPEPAHGFREEVEVEAGRWEHAATHGGTAGAAAAAAGDRAEATRLWPVPNLPAPHFREGGPGVAK